MITVQNCIKHNQEITQLCLAEECKEDLFLCEECSSSKHKHSKTDIKLIKEVEEKLKGTWEPKESAIQPYFSRVREFYQNLRN
jgi:hypothetical protein